MSYIKTFEEELSHKIEVGENRDAIVRWVSGKILDSYKNGLAVGRKAKAKSVEPPSNIPVLPQA